jgi:hypothetical protein
MPHQQTLSPLAQARWRPRSVLGLGAIAVVTVFLAWFYIAGARENARVMNLEKSRGDQTLYMVMALEVYANRHGEQPPIVHRRNRMPLYPWLQSWFWDERMTHWEYFYAGRERNIYLSVGLLAVLGAIFSRLLRPLVAVNLTLVLAFGCFIYKAGYFQPELLFYTLFFCAFLVCCGMLATSSSRALLVLGAAGGTLAALAHLTKAAMLPFVGLFLAVQAGRTIRDAVRANVRPGDRIRQAAWRIAAAAVFLGCFLAVLSPYISTSKRVFGRYFYNVNTTFYVWYDNWGQAIKGTRSLDDEAQWPRMRRRDLPGPRKYLREHTAGQIAARFRRGFADMAIVSYTGYNYLKYVVLYLAFTALLAGTRPRAVAAALRGRAALVWFVSLLAAAYLAATAFYEPISATGTARFMLVMLAPLLFTASWIFSRPSIRAIEWRTGGIVLSPAHFHLLVLATLALDIAFTTWPRLLTTYGGF